MSKAKKAAEKQKSSRKNRVNYHEGLVRLNEHAAGIDVGSEEHWVCVPYGSCEEGKRVLRFEAFTKDLHAICSWLKLCGVKTVAMESTGVYWIALYELLEQAGFDVWLVNARYVKRVPGRPKTDRLDCEWIQRLHCYGLLRRSFRPQGDICAIRSLWRARDCLIEEHSRVVRRIQACLQQMNVLLHKVIGDITGKTGMAIMQAIVAGERDPERLVELRDARVKAPPERLAEALRGNYRDELVELLGLALEQLGFLRGQISQLDASVEQRVRKLSANETELPQSVLSESPVKRNTHQHAPSFDAVHLVQSLYGAPVGDIPGMGSTVLTGLLSELGLDLSRWENRKRFTSWLSLSPKARISGGKPIGSCSTAKTGNRAGYYFRQAASSLKHSDTALGQFYRRMRGRKGTQHAIVATARKLAEIFYTMVTEGTAYHYIEATEYDEKLRQWRLNRLKRQAAALGFELTEKPAA